jgi:hypothetical protein
MVDQIDIAPVDLKDTSPEYQETRTDLKTIFKEKIEKKDIEHTFPPFSQELEEAKKEVISNKLEIVSNHLGQPVNNQDLAFFGDFGLSFTLPRSKSFHNRKKRFLKNYPEGEYIRQSISIGNKTHLLELYKKDSSDKEYSLVNPFGFEASDIPQAMGTVLNLQTAGETTGIVAGTVVNRASRGAIPVTPFVFAGSWIGRKGDKLIDKATGYGEEEFADNGFNYKDFFLNYNDLLTSTIGAGFYFATSMVADKLIFGKGPGKIDIAPELTEMAEKLGLDPIVFAQLAVNPQIRNIYSQAGGFSKRVDKIRQKQIDSVLKALNEGKLFKGLRLTDETGAAIGPKITTQDLIDAQGILSQQIKDGLKINFNIKKGFATQAEADQSLKNLVVNFNTINKRFETQFYNGAVNSAIKSKDGMFNIKNLVDQTFTKEINKLISSVSLIGKQGKDKVYKGAYKSLKDVPELKKIYKAMQFISKKGGNNFATNPKGATINLKTLYTIREDLHKLMGNSKYMNDPNVLLAARKMHERLLYYLDPKNKQIFGSPEFVGNIKLLNSMHTQKETVGMMEFIRKGFLEGTDMSAFTQAFIQPGKYTNFGAIKEMLRLPGDAPASAVRDMDKIVDIMKNYWITSTFKSPNANQILDDFMRLDPESLKTILKVTNDKDMIFKVESLKNLVAKADELENGIIGQALSKNATSLEFMNGIINKAKSGDYGTSKSMDDLIQRLGGPNSATINDIRNNIMKDLFKKSLKISEDTGPKRLQEVLDSKLFADNIKALREDPNLSKFFTGDQFDAFKTFEQYSRALGGGIDSGGSIARGAETAQIVQKFRIIDAGLNILKYDLAAWLLARPQYSAMLKKIRPGEGVSTYNIDIITGAIVAAERELTEKLRKKDKFQDEGIIDVSPVAAGATPTRTSSINIPPEISRGSPESNRVASANANMFGPVGMGREPAGSIDPNRAAFAFGPDDILAQQRPQYAAQGGIMSTNKAFQRVA